MENLQIDLRKLDREFANDGGINEMKSDLDQYTSVGSLNDKLKTNTTSFELNEYIDLVLSCINNHHLELCTII